MASFQNNTHYKEKSKSNDKSGKIQGIESRFECPICLNCLRKPILTTCGHRFCEECIHKWLKQEDGNCPIDGLALSLTNDLFPDNYTRREISQQQIKCPIEDCSQELPLTEADKHITDFHHNVLCEEEVIKCVFHHIGCIDVFTSKQQLRLHLSSYLEQHLEMLSSAYSRLSDECHSKDHLNNVKEEESAMWTPQSKHNGDQVDASQTLIKTLYERIILLEQSNREQEIQLVSLRTSLTQAINDNIEMKVDWPLRYCNGIYVWTIKNFTKKYSTMVEEQGTIFHSPGFYTSYVGYRFCARINLSVQDRNYITLLIHLMQGEADTVLDWPFCGRISFTLIHPTDAEKSVKETMMSRPELEAFKQPSREINPRGFGYHEFVLVSEIFKSGFLNNDCITIKVQVQAV